MSEYQYIGFQAVDRSLTNAELAYARKQSTRADISPSSFTNHYHFGDFHGDVNGLLRRGYDVHLHYANFGIRTIAFRLPAGLPFAEEVWSNYIGGEELSWATDRRGNGGILTLDPYYEAGELDELWELEPYMPAMIELRKQLISGDLRVLYLFWLAGAIGQQQESVDVKEPPVPSGLAEIAGAFQPFMDFFGLDPQLLAAVAEASTESPRGTSPERLIQQWVEFLSEADAKSLLHELLADDSPDVKSATMAKILAETDSPIWPTVMTDRTWQEVLSRAAQLRQAQHKRDEKRRVAAEKRKAARQAREQQERMKRMLDDPKKWLRTVDELVAARGIDNYETAAELLDELREALADEDGAELTRKHAAHLAKKHPTLNRMKSALRKHGLLE